MRWEGKLPTYSLSVHERSAVTDAPGHGGAVGAMVRAHKGAKRVRSHGCARRAA